MKSCRFVARGQRLHGAQCVLLAQEFVKLERRAELVISRAELVTSRAELEFQSALGAEDVLERSPVAGSVEDKAGRAGQLECICQLAEAGGCPELNLALAGCAGGQMGRILRAAVFGIGGGGAQARESHALCARPGQEEAMDRRAVLRSAASRRGAWRAPAATGVSHVLPDPPGRLLTPDGCPESGVRTSRYGFTGFSLQRQKGKHSTQSTAVCTVWAFLRV